MELIVRYREYAADCIRIAQQISDARTKLSLLDMAQVWVMLAEHTEKNGAAASGQTATEQPA